ncbi:hypothetical protein PF007_g23393 [Phytophthora fragariae]|uniref:Peptidase S1 domain-containing protein n=1 Tax=Phytophthora fragariae TaxID=53985 RepID=A0A6A3QN98_9STRA|nr:hypothetical protein PF007_g23393 [Phytophthora fragariae]
MQLRASERREVELQLLLTELVPIHFLAPIRRVGEIPVITSPTDNSSISHTYTGRGRDQSGTFIASFVPGSSVTVTYTSVGAATAGQGYRITGYSRGYPTMDQESICGDGDQSLPAKCYALGTNLSEGCPRRMRSEGHLFTNHHCFEQEDWALTTDFEFATESSSCSDHEGIDYSVVQLPDCVDLSAYGYLQLRESGPVVNESTYVPQHPDGNAKRIVSTVDGGSDSTILSVGEDGSCGTDQVGHDADTQGGSSGSPLLSTSKS